MSGTLAPPTKPTSQTSPTSPSQPTPPTPPIATAGGPSWWAAVAAIMRKDLREEFRTGESLAALGVFGVLVVTLFAFAFDPQGVNLRPVFAGLLWIGFLFAGMLGMGRSFARERDNDALVGLLLAPMDPSAVFYGKLLANAAFVLLAEAILLPIFFALLQVPFPAGLALPGTIVLATVGFVAVGTLMSAIVAQVRVGEVLLPLGALPLLAPLLIAAVRLGQAAVGAGAASPPGSAPVQTAWYGLLVAYDVVFLAVPALLFDFVVEV